MELVRSDRLDEYMKEQFNVDMAITWEEAGYADPCQAIQPADYFRYGVFAGVAVTLVAAILIVRALRKNMEF